MFHATFILGNSMMSSEKLDEMILASAVELGDREEQEVETFGIDDARNLFQKASYKNTQSGYALFVTRCQRITLPAQNALLKLLEEPPQETLFVFSMPRDALLLSTLTSRVNILGAFEGKQREHAQVHAFLTGPSTDRLKLVQDMQEDVEEARDFLTSLAVHTENILFNERSQEWKHFGRAVETALLYLNDPSASRKMLLEHVALACPQ